MVNLCCCTHTYAVVLFVLFCVRRDELAQKRRANVALVPYLQAEEDLRYLQKHGEKQNVGLTTWLAPFDVPYR